LSDTLPAGFVRAARESDAPALARVQVASWRAELSGVVPQEVLGQLTSDEAMAQFESRWQQAITAPPTSRHHVLVAVAASPGRSMTHGQPSTAVDDSSTAINRRVVGFASAGPASDPDLWPATDGQLFELRVLPEQAGQGHDGRLMHAVADTLAEEGFTTLSTWALEPDAAYRSFLESAGWAADGAHGELDVGMEVSVMRLRTAIGSSGGEQE
jgi:ribosomal protein S18 acetylase RimI-like enzyme